MQDKVFSLTDLEAAYSKTTVAGQLSSVNTSLIVLFDSRATHSFVSSKVDNQLCRPGCELKRAMHVIFPFGDRVVSRRGI